MWEDASNRSLGGGGGIRLGFLNEAIIVTKPTARPPPRVLPGEALASGPKSKEVAHSSLIKVNNT